MIVLGQKARVLVTSDSRGTVPPSITLIYSVCVRVSTVNESDRHAHTLTQTRAQQLSNPVTVHQGIKHVMSNMAIVAMVPWLQKKRGQPRMRILTTLLLLSSFKNSGYFIHDSHLHPEGLT
ncbi:hypothetical protein O6H91_21G062800 [Diphasiastrum complanatum]|uniref:Uncharacterized protein n=1 Tax=Diphasiastrum complanatum TaxID=34168 RepID=A0ACC2AL52_DIPCM|nr:hypothetical protein O6H91_21G062800 [Diphasiastrum complanatum]